MGEKKFQTLLAKARRHLRFVIELCKDQMDNGCYFLFEHPASASSWKEPEMERLMARPSVVSTVANMCQFGMQTFPDGSLGPVAKPTRFATNSPRLCDALDRKCNKEHVHAHLLGGRAAAAQEYPPALCEAIVVGMKAQMRDDDGQVLSLEMHESDMDDNGHFSGTQSVRSSLDLLHQSDFSDGDSSASGDEATDDVHGGKLDPDQVRAARAVEMSWNLRIRHDAGVLRRHWR